MRRVMQFAVYPFALIGFFYILVVSYSYLIPRDAALDSDSGLCDRKLLSEMTSPDLEQMVLHTAEFCSDGAESHTLRVCEIGESLFNCGVHQILMSSRYTGQDIAKVIRAPLDFEWIDESHVIIRGPGNVVKIISPSLGGVSITTEATD